MSLQLILGSSGSGKSHQLYNEIINKSINKSIKKSIDYEDVNYLVIVPEQFTLQTQKEIVTKHPYKGTMNIDILSFMRLAHRIFDELGGNEKIALDDTGKSMILRKVISLKQDELIFFGRESNKIGFVSELKSLVSEMFQYSITSKELEEVRENIKDKPMLSNKLHDIILIYNGFKEYLEDKYITGEEILDVLCDVIGKSDLIKNSIIAFDGFTGFTPSQYKLLGLLMKLSKKVLITVTIDEREQIDKDMEEFLLFHLSKKTINHLYEIADENKIKIDKAIYPISDEGEGLYRFKNKQGLASLERNLFRYPYNTYTKTQDEIEVHVCEDGKHEVSFVVRETMRLVREEKYRYQDIAIITGDIGQYANPLEREFERAGVPVFIDNKRELLNNPFVEMLRSMLDIVKKDFDYESVFRFLRCGLLDYSNDAIDVLENYIIAFGIRGKSTWAKEWERTYKGQQEGELPLINEVRQELVDYITPLFEILMNKEKTVEDYTRSIYNHVLELGIEERLDSLREDFEAKGMMVVAKEYEQIYGIVIDLLEKLVELLGDEHLELDEYIEILEAGLSEAKVGVIPPGMDQVVVGDIERTRLSHVKAVFFVGVNDGIIPASGKDGGILSDFDREVLSEQELEMAPTRREEAYMEQFYLYLIMTKPTDKLYLSYSKLDGDGKVIRPSYLIGVIEKLYPNIEIIDEENIAEDEVGILASDKGIKYLIRGLRNYSSEVSDYWRELFSYYYKDEDGKDLIDNLLKGTFYSNHEIGLKTEVAKDLYGSDLLGSVTRFEQFGACPFAHFAKYGLNLRERVEYSLRALDIGNLFHDSLEIFSKRLYNSGNDWESLSDQVQSQWVDESVTEAANNPNNAIFSSSKRHEYIVSRAKRITNRTIWALKQQITKGDFVPSGFEIYFSSDNNMESLRIPLTEDSSIKLHGRIDRIDVYKEDDKVMVRVIDYKSGSTSFDLLSVYHGLQLQLAIYLNASLEYLKKLYPGKEIIPAGILYYHIDDPIVDKNSDVESSILKALKMDGVVNEDSEVIVRLDKSFKEVNGLKPGVNSDVIPVKTNKDGSIGKVSKVVTSKELGFIEEYVTRVVKDFGKDILEGDTGVEPYKLKNKIACEYCPYDSVCGFDIGIEGFYYHRLEDLKDEAIWDKINESIKKLEDENKEEGGTD